LPQKNVLNNTAAQDKTIIKWNNFHAVAMLIISIYCIQDDRLGIIFGVAFISFSILIYSVRKSLLRLSPIGGYCNWVTFFRLLFIGVFCIFFHQNDYSIFWLPILVGAISLDAVDGYLARKFNQESMFGQYFDMEVDSFFVLVLSFYYYHYCEIAIWILIPAFLRYVYKMARLLLVKNDFQEPKRKLSTYIAGYYFTVLLVGFLVEGIVQKSLLLSGVILIAISFLISYYEFLTHRNSTSVSE